MRGELVDPVVAGPVAQDSDKRQEKQWHKHTLNYPFKMNRGKEQNFPQSSQILSLS